MKLEDFTAGVNQLRHLLNPDKRGQYRPKEISRYLKDSTPFLQKILKLSRDDKTHPAASFARDLLYTCDSIAAELPPNLQLPIFDSWELWMRERSSCVKLEEDTPLPAAFLPVLSKPRGRKRQAPPVEDSGNDNAPGNNNEEGKATSDKEESGGNDGDEDNDGGEADESERETLPKHTGGKIKAKTHRSGQTPVLPNNRSSTSGVLSLAKDPKSQQQTRSRTKDKFAAPTEPIAAPSVTVRIGPPRKALKTQPGSVKDEPTPIASGSRKSRASKRFPTGEEEKPLASSSKVKAPAMVTVKNKQYLALSTHKYGRAAPIPVKDAEVDAITQASTVPQYGCAQCSSSVQNQSCIFLGWGNRCNNCEAATKSLCSFRAEPLQRYFARRELAKFVEATPDNVRTSIGRAAIALQVFETCANAAALAAQQYRTSLEEALRICQDAATSEGRDALQGIVFESVDFEEQLRAALLKMDMSSPALLTTSETDSLPSTVAPTVSRTLLESESPSRPLIGSSGVPTIPVRSREGGMAPKVDSSDQVGALVDQLASSPVHHLSPESPEAA